MGSLLDLLREGDYWAKQSRQQEIGEQDIQKAIDTRQYRQDQIRERVHEQVIRGDYLLDTSGEKVAQINALSIIQLGDYAFGRPSKITATARLGQGKVIDIEREVKLGGLDTLERSHDTFFVPGEPLCKRSAYITIGQPGV